MATIKKKETAQKAAPNKPNARPTAAKKSPARGREEALADEALKMVDKAAVLLRKGIRTSAETTHKARLEAKQQAHGLLSKASSVLGDLLSESTSTLHKVINKI
jgi:hypothetical protein